MQKKVDRTVQEGPRVLTNPKGSIKFPDLPLKYPNQVQVTHACDAIVDLPLPMPDIDEHMKKLPKVLRTEVALAISMKRPRRVAL